MIIIRQKRIFAEFYGWSLLDNFQKRFGTHVSPRQNRRSPKLADG